MVERFSFFFFSLRWGEWMEEGFRICTSSRSVVRYGDVRVDLGSMRSGGSSVGPGLVRIWKPSSQSQSVCLPSGALGAWRSTRAHSHIL